MHYAYLKENNQSINKRNFINNKKLKHHELIVNTRYQPHQMRAAKRADHKKERSVFQVISNIFFSSGSGEHPRSSGKVSQAGNVHEINDESIYRTIKGVVQNKKKT